MPVALAAWTDLVGDGQDRIDCWARLVGRWTESHRRYHGIGHLSAMLLFIDEYADHADDADAVRLAAWYHDAVYDPRSPDNEERSAGLAETELGALGQPEGQIAEVFRLVRLTSTHDPAEGDRNGELLNDADLMVLSSPPEAYVAYLNAIREEYAHVPDADFRTGRAAILETLLDTPQLYRLEALAPVEAAARRNLSAELSLLRTDLPESSTDTAREGGAVPPDEAPSGPPGH